MELDAWLASNLTSEETRETYEYFMRPEPKDVRSDLLIEEGTGLRYRLMAVGMTRNASDDNRPTRKVYLDPIPHIRLENAKPLQGWYKSKIEKAGVRERPCFTDAMLTEPYGGYCAVGCAFSLVAGELIDTPNGPRPIESLEIGDEVYGRTHEGRVVVQVEATTNHWKEEGYVILELEDGRELRVTADHPVYSEVRGWVNAADLQPGETLEDVGESEVLSGLRGAYSKAAECVRQLFASDSRGERSEVTYHSNGSPLSGLRIGDLGSKGDLRRLRSESQIRERGSKQGATQFSERASEIRRDSEEDERSRVPESEEHGGQGFWSEIARMAGGPSGAREIWREWLQTVEAFVVHGPEGAHLSYALPVGSLGGTLAGFPGARLGVRAGGVASSERIGVHPRLQADGWAVVGGEGVHGRDERREDDGSSRLRTSDRRDGRDDAPKARCVRVRPVSGGLTVYDIQTPTRNFYQRGVLVHNCYINSGVRGYRGSGLISVPMDYGEQVAKQLAKAKTSAAGYFSSFTDPFLPLEDVYHNTQRGIEAFTNVGLPVFILSRKKYPSWAMDALMKNPHSYAQKSINTWHEPTWRKLSPGAATLAEHMEDIRELRSRGIYVSIQLNPVLPGIVTHDDVEKTIEMLAEAGANHVIVKFVEAGFSWAPEMVKRVHHRFDRDNPEGAAKFAELFCDNIGGQRTIAEEYRMEGHHRYRKKATECGVTYATCYEYKYERDAIGRILNKRGVSIGREFITSEQCHGQKVPMYSRRDLTREFKPVPECPPTGCLYCADDNGGKPKCGSALFGAAKALRDKDFKSSVWDEVPAPKDPNLPEGIIIDPDPIGDLFGE